MGQCKSQALGVPEFDFDDSFSDDLEMEDPNKTEKKGEKEEKELFLQKMQKALENEPEICYAVEKIFTDHSDKSISVFSFACKGAEMLRHHEDILDAFATLLPSGINLEIGPGAIEIREEKADGEKQIINRLFK